MITDQWQKAKELFVAALEYPPDERLRFVDENCNGDEAVRREVESLLANSDDASVFLEQPAIGEVAEAIFENKEKLQVSKNFGHYKIIKTLGTGGMGEVYLANDTKLDRRVAIKILKWEFSRDETNLGRFVQEAKAASGLNHPNILVIHEIGESRDARYIVSEFIDGKTLREIIRESPMNLSEALDIAIQTAGALTAAHGAHIVHRDIKPENIMVRPDGYVKILDFGLAKLIEQKNRSLIGLEDETAKQNNTAKGVILGTIAYMSPEQARAEQVDERTDIFSFGILMYEMIAGRVPFTGDSMPEAFANLINKEPPPLSRFESDVPSELQRIVAKMLRKNKDERYQTMKGLLADLRELKENLAFEEKLNRSTSPNDEKETRHLVAHTEDFEKKPTAAGENFTVQIKRRKAISIAALIVLLICAAGISYYYLNEKKIPLGKDEKTSIAVLPFTNAAQDPNAEYLSDGIGESLINRLSQLSGLKVMSGSSVFRYKGKEQDAQRVGNELNVQAVLTGSVKQIGDQLIINVSLDDTQDNHHIWGEQYVRKFADVLAVQSEIAQEVATNLRLKLTGTDERQFAKRYTDNVEAYQLYLKGLYVFNKHTQEDLQKSIEYYNQALKKTRTMRWLTKGCPALTAC